MLSRPITAAAVFERGAHVLIGIQVLLGIVMTIHVCRWQLCPRERRRRQRACLEHVDSLLTPLLESFRDATTVLTADHGDCWGEDGLWEHGISHRRTLEVPLLMRVRGVPLD